MADKKADEAKRKELEAKIAKLTAERVAISKDDTIPEGERRGKVSALYEQLVELDEQLQPLLPPEAK